MKRRAPHEPADTKRVCVEAGAADECARMRGLLKKWGRPPLPPLADTLQPLEFQLMDGSYYEGDSRFRGRCGGSGGSSSRTAIIRMFGVTTEQHSVFLHVHGFMPYFYVCVWEGFHEAQCGDFRLALQKELQQFGGESVVKVEPVRRRSVWGFNGSDDLETFLRVTMAHPKMVAPARRAVEEGLLFGTSRVNFTAYEAKMPFFLRFLIDNSLSGGGWVRVDASKFEVRSAKTRVSRCQIEADCWFSDVIGLPVSEFMSMAPLRTLSFDIECANRKSTFPEPEHDPVIQIGITVSVHGRERTENDCHTVLTWKSCTPIPGAEVLSFDTEKELLSAFQQVMLAVDPDVLIGYNIANFDFPYLLSRAARIGVSSFPYLGRVVLDVTRMKDTTFSSRAYGTRESKEISIDGRCQLDIMQVIQRDYKLRSYSLNSVSAHFLKQQKEDVHHSIITDLFNGSAETRQRLASYCLKDAVLPMRLMHDLLILTNYVEMARVSGVPVTYLLSRGQQIKVLSQLYRKARARDFVVPNRPRVEEQTYEGATVLEPKKGYYTDPIATLDFSSLYPSIMMAHNLCYSTLVHPNVAKNLPAEDYVRTPTGDLFVRASKRRGLLPEILEELLAARKVAKKEMAKETDPLRKNVLNGRQLALKISANSVYGFTGAIIGQLPCLAISSSVTAYGRQMIERTKELVEDMYSVKNGAAHNADVIYGDTDSVMIKFGGSSVEECMALAKEAADRVSATFEKPIRLEFEKVYFPYLLMNKKRYAGLYWTKPEKWDRMDTKGIETVRRDNCDLVRMVIEMCLHKILIDRDVEGALQYVKGVISDLLCNQIDMSQLVISKQLGKDPLDQVNKMAHSELAKRMHKRDPTTAPSVGDRVAYVIVRASKGARAYEKAEDPIFVLENGIPIDTRYYLEHQLQQPLQRLFEPILGNCSSLFAGDHTRTIKVSTPSVGGIMRFAVVKETCLGCKVPLSKGERAVCKHCHNMLGSLYDRHLQQHRHNEQLFAKLWTQCQRCQGSLLQDVLCSSRDCPIFYRRTKVKHDLAESQKKLERLQF